MEELSELPPKLRPKQAARAKSVSRPTLLRWEKQFTDFPKPQRPTPRVTLYDRDKLLAWEPA